MLRPAAKASGDVTQVKSILLVTSDPERTLPLRRSLALLQPVRTLCLTSRHSRGGPLSLDGISQELAARREIERDGTIAAIVSDVPLHDIDTVRQLRSAFEPFLLQRTPILCLLADRTHAEEVQARALGASAVLATCSTGSELAAALRPWLRVAGRRPDGDATPAAAAADVGLAIADMLGAAMQGTRINMHAVAEASDIMLEAIAGHGIHGWLQLVSDVDDRTYRHCMMVSGFVTAFALALGFSHTDCDRLTRASLMHDIGKGVIPLGILNKAGALDAREMAIMRGHAAAGHDLLMVRGDAVDQHEPMTLDVVRHHHEALDGTGYPDCLAGAAIADPVRIVTICDVFTALIEDRPYKSALAGHEAFRIMRDTHGKFDSHLLAMFNRVFDRAPR